MSLKIRMSRAGAKKRPFYRIVVADSRSPRDGRFLEKLGTYNPILPREHKDRLVLNLDRVKHWLGVGATPSERCQKFFAEAGLCEKPTVHPQTKQHLNRKERKAGPAAAPAAPAA